MAHRPEAHGEGGVVANRVVGLAGRRVVMVVGAMAPGGGMEEYATALSEALALAGATVDWFSAKPADESNQYVQRLRAAGVRLHLPQPPAPLSMVTLARAARRLRRRLGLPARGHARYPDVVPDLRYLLIRLERHIAGTRPDVIHVHGSLLYPAELLPHIRRMGVPTVYSEHNNVLEHPDGFRPGLPGLVDAADIVTADAGAAAAALGSCLPRPREVPVLRMITASPPVPRSARKDRPFTLMTVLRLEDAKGVPVLLGAFADLVRKVPDARLLIAGDGPQRAGYESVCRAFDLTASVTFLGSVPRAVVLQQLLECDTFVLPSLSEANPLTLHEAMAAGRAVIATAVGGTNDVVTDGEDGILVPRGESLPLLAAMLRLANDRLLRERMGAAARATWERDDHRAATAAREIASLYEQAISVHRGRYRTPPRLEEDARPRGVRADAADALLFGALLCTALLPARLWRTLCWDMAGFAARRRHSRSVRLPGWFIERYGGGSARAAFRRTKAIEYGERVRFVREWLPVLPHARVRLDGDQHLHAALGTGRGAIVWVGLSADSFLAAKKALGAAGFLPSHLSRPGHGYFLSPLGGWLNRPQLDVERRYVAERVLVSAQNGPAALRVLARRLTANAVVTITFDDAALRPIRLAFLGGELGIPPGPIRLAMLSGAALLPAFVRREGEAFVLVVEAPLPVGRSLEEVAEAYLQRLDRHVAVDPLAWAGTVSRTVPEARPR